MKKTTAFMLTLIITLTFVWNNVYAYESTQKSSTLTEVDEEVDEEKIEGILSDGETYTDETSEARDGTQTTSKTKEELVYTQSTGTISKTITKTLVSVLIVIPYLINGVLTMAVADTEHPFTTKEDKFTIQNLLMGEYSLFDINFWKESSGKNEKVINEIRQNVATWYYSLRNIAAVMMVVILIYTGIRLAMMTANSEEQSSQKMAKYKKMLINWLTGIALIFILHLLMICVIKLENAVSSAIVNIAKSSTAGEGVENEIMNGTWSNLWSSESKYAQYQFYYFIIYCMLAYYELKFFVVYFYRALKIYFYVIISPLICMTYVIDKMEDDRSQAFENWFNEFLKQVIKRPIHLLVYVIMIISAGEVMQRAPLLAVTMLALLSHSEETIKKIFMLDKGEKDVDLKDVKMRDFDIIGKFRQ